MVNVFSISSLSECESRLFASMEGLMFATVYVILATQPLPTPLLNVPNLTVPLEGEFY